MYQFAAVPSHSLCHSCLSLITPDIAPDPSALVLIPSPLFSATRPRAFAQTSSHSTQSGFSQMRGGSRSFAPYSPTPINPNPVARAALATWFPPGSGLVERIEAIASAHPGGFQPLTAPGEEAEYLDQDLAEHQLHRHIVLQRAKVKLRAIHRFQALGRESFARRSREGGDGGQHAASMRR